MFWRRRPRIHHITRVYEDKGHIKWQMPAADFDELFKDADVFMIDGQIIGNLGHGEECVIVVREKEK